MEIKEEKGVRKQFLLFELAAFYELKKQIEGDFKTFDHARLQNIALLSTIVINFQKICKSLEEVAEG